MRAARSESDLARVLREAPEDVSADDHVGPRLVTAGTKGNWRTTKRDIEGALELVVVSESQLSDQSARSSSQQAKDILAKAKYRDSGVRGSKNWMSRSFERVAQWLQERIERLSNPPKATSAAPGLLPIGLLDPLVWVLLALGLIVFLTFTILRFQWAARKGRRLGVLGEGEPDLTADEWLARAADLERLGQLRDAVRCLYLASLTRLDEAGRLRFVRAETNWEHLRRFEANVNRPADLDLRQATKEFDRIWYGHRMNGVADVDWFRDFYKSVLTSVRRTA